ncbi:MAG TPA: D-alanine--D-alanine ligase family protein [Actinomycetes bacterium]|nr:D-alanine--D-alanine ligase family protein [Actinomycetes bacterium]
MSAQPDPPSSSGDTHKPRVAVVFGGRSSEHAISCVTAGSVLAAIDPEVYEVIPIGISREGRWVLSGTSPEQLAITDGRLPAVEDTGAAVVLAGDPTSRELVTAQPGAVPRALGEVDVVFPLLHGPYGEDGTLQGLLELAGIPYVGSGVLSSAVAMDKEYMKKLFIAAGLPVADYLVVRPRDWERDKVGVAERVAGLGWPVFVKPARAGSSIGITKVAGPEQLSAAMETAHEWDPKVLVEAAVVAREVECGVLDSLDGDIPETSVVAEIKVRGGHEFYDFEAKYLPDEGTEYDVPADIPARVSDEVRRLAVAAFLAMGCEGLARVDFFLRTDGSVLLNEVNTMPGFTPVSMFPVMWRESGVPYPELVDRLIKLALRRPTGLR